MVVYVTESGSDSTELVETLVKEGVTIRKVKPSPSGKQVLPWG